MVRFQRHWLIASLQYIGNVTEYLSTACCVIRQDSGMGAFPLHGMWRFAEMNDFRTGPQ